MKKRRYKNWAALFTANLYGVFNDNFLKHCIIFITVTWSLPSWLSQAQIISAVSAALVIPYLVLSPFAGTLSVRKNKKSIFTILKLSEIPVMLLACISFYFQWIILAIISVLLLGAISCLYSPSKYSLIRDIGGEKNVSFGSGMVEAMAFLGILLGALGASVMSDHYQYAIFASILIGLAILGFISASSLKVKELPVNIDSNSTNNPIKFFISNYKFAKKYKDVNIAILGYSLFWLIAGLIQMNLIIHCKKVLELSNTMTGVIMAIVATGVISGCMIIGKISKDAVKSEFIFYGLGGMILILAFILIFNPGFIAFGIAIFIFAFLGGCFQVPCLALVQKADVGRKLGDLMAYLNLLTFVFVLGGTLLFSLLNIIFDDNSFVIFGLILLIAIISLTIFIVKSPHLFIKKVGK
jgi:MFS family permease